MKLTLSRVLASMESGKDYTATRLSLRIGARTAEVLGLLHKLVDNGHVELSRSTPRSLLFRLVEADENRTMVDADDSDQAQTSIATFPVTRVMVGSLSDYDSALMARRDLAMQTRGRNR